MTTFLRLSSASALLAASGILSLLHLIVSYLPCAASPSSFYPLEHWAVVIVVLSVQGSHFRYTAATGDLLALSTGNGNVWRNFVRWNGLSVNWVQARCFENLL